MRLRHGLAAATFALLVSFLTVGGASAQDADDAADTTPSEDAAQSGDQSLDTEMSFAPPVIASGDPRGVYYAVAHALADIVDAPIEVMTTTGSMENLVRLQVDEVQLAIAQSDRVAQAVIGLPPFDDAAPATGLRTVVALFPEPLNVLVRADSGIETVTDLVGRRVNFGTRDDLTGRLFHQVMDAYGVADAEIDGTAVPIGEQGDFLCAGEIDAIALIAAHPSGSLYRIAEQCALRALPIAGGAAQSLLADIPALAPATIPGGLYPGVDEPVRTLGPVALLVTDMDGDPGLIDNVVTGLIENLDAFRASHPALSNLTLQGLRGPGLAAPLHPRAEATLSALAPIE